MHIRKNHSIFASLLGRGVLLVRIVLWCNGSTAVFGSACPGSNPGKTTRLLPAAQCGRICFTRKPPKSNALHYPVHYMASHKITTMSCKCCATASFDNDMKSGVAAKLQICFLIKKDGNQFDWTKGFHSHIRRRTACI